MPEEQYNGVNRRNVHETRLTDRRNGDQEGLTVPSDVGDNRNTRQANNDVPAGANEEFNTGRRNYPQDTLERE